MASPDVQAAHLLALERVNVAAIDALETRDATERAERAALARRFADALRAYLDRSDVHAALHVVEASRARLAACSVTGATEVSVVVETPVPDLLDGLALAKLSSQHGVGVGWSELRVPTVDVDLFESLTAS